MRIPLTIQLTEPTAPRYITINHETNQVHLMVPVVGGQEISTDNTCKATVALREFFDGGALRELNAYKEALVFDIRLLEAGNADRMGKEARLAQIEVYIEAVSAMSMSFGDAITAFLGRPSNLYSIQLRPREQDFESRVVNPVFNVNRTNSSPGGIPLSALFNAMHSTFPATVVAATDPRTRLKAAVLGTIPESPSFTDIQGALGEQSLALFGLAIDFTKDTDGIDVTQENIDSLMGFDEVDVEPKDYIEALLGVCAHNAWETLPTRPFYSIPAATPVDERTERLSILTQFFLANLNVYCKARDISDKNFGVVLDASPDLSNELARVVSEALTNGEDVEGAIYNFCNVKADIFGLSPNINAKDLTSIRQAFERTYRTVTATNENPHMDDFMILDRGATGEKAKCVAHQGAICVNFAEIIDPTAAAISRIDLDTIRTDFAQHPAEIPHKNEWVAGIVDIEAEVLLERITDDQFERLPDAVKVECRAHPTFQRRQFLQDVAKGRQDEAEALLTGLPANTQSLLRTPGVFTDYSGRTFNCTAYEYAYWAKDTHMRRMLERHMDDDTKAYMLARIDEIERLDAATGKPMGLVYSQGGYEHRSAHFDLGPLISALQKYVHDYSKWALTKSWSAMKPDWMAVGILQRDLPVHVVNEYCRPDRSFYPRPEFNEEALPRSLEYYNAFMNSHQALFPLDISGRTGLGFDFVLTDAEWWRGAVGKNWVSLEAAARDLEAVSHLNEVRTLDLTRSREILRQTDLAPSHRMRTRLSHLTLLDTLASMRINRV